MQNKSIKIVHIIEGFLGGTCTYMCTVLPELSKRGFDVTLITSINRSCEDTKTKISALRESGVKVEIIPMYREINPFRDMYSLISITSLLRKNKYEIIHTHCSEAGFLVV